MNKWFCQPKTMGFAIAEEESLAEMENNLFQRAKFVKPLKRDAFLTIF